MTEEKVWELLAELVAEGMLLWESPRASRPRGRAVLNEASGGGGSAGGIYAGASGGTAGGAGVEAMRRVRSSQAAGGAALPIVDAIESRVIRQAMAMFPEHPYDAAYYLGISVEELKDRVKRLGIEQS